MQRVHFTCSFGQIGDEKLIFDGNAEAAGYGRGGAGGEAGGGRQRIRIRVRWDWLPTARFGGALYRGKASACHPVPPPTTSLSACHCSCFLTPITVPHVLVILVSASRLAPLSLLQLNPCAAVPHIARLACSCLGGVGTREGQRKCETSDGGAYMWSASANICTHSGSNMNRSIDDEIIATPVFLWHALCIDK